MTPGTSIWELGMEVPAHPQWTWRPGLLAGLVSAPMGEGLIRPPIWWRLTMFEGQLSGCPAEGARGGVALWTDFLERTKLHATPIIDLEDDGTAGVLWTILTEDHSNNFKLRFINRWHITMRRDGDTPISFSGPSLGVVLAQTLREKWKSK